MVTLPLNMKFFVGFITILISLAILGCNIPVSIKSTGLIVGSGQMPNIIKDISDNFHLVFGSGDSILYSYSSDHGKSFSSPALISLLPKLAASHMRGPQVAATSDG